MKRKYLTLGVLLVVLCAFVRPYQHQSEFNNGQISFKSKKKNVTSYVEDFTSTFNQESSEMTFEVPIANFVFANPMMYKHFMDDGAMDGLKYPTATFVGTLVGEVDYETNGAYDVMAKGKLKIHGVEQDVDQKASITVKDGQIEARCNMLVNRKQYDINGGKAKMLDDDIQVSIKAMYVL